MDGQRFDRIVKFVATGISRRRAVGALVASVTPFAGLALGSRRAAAQDLAAAAEVSGEASDGKCQGKAAFNNKHCAADRCSRNGACVCATTTHGDKRCVSLVGAVCPTRDECNNDKQCGKGEVCIKIGGCCGHGKRNLCIDVCGK